MTKLIPLLINFVIFHLMAHAQDLTSIGPIIRLLNDSSSASNRFEGFRLAAMIDSTEVNNELAKLLDSTQGSELILDMLIPSSWEHALILLAKRFPEAGVPKRPGVFDRSDAEVFKKWWSENQDRIEYHNNTYRFISGPSPQKQNAEGEEKPLTAEQFLQREERLKLLTKYQKTANQLAFEVQESEDATLYNLQFHQGEAIKTIWSRQVPLVNGKRPYDWCNLIGWARNEHGLLALVENNEFFGKLLQFNSNGDLLAELEAGGSWLQDIRRGGHIQLAPPDRIEVTSPSGKVTKYLIREGQLADENGKIFERPKPLVIQIGKPALVLEERESEGATIYNLQFHHEQSVKTIWSMRVPLVDGKKPYYGCSLIKWAQNEHGLLALVENNDMWGKLLQFSSNGDLMAELETGGKWVRDFWKGGSIQLEPPDSIEVTSLDGKITKYLVRNGQWADEHGRIFERTPPLQIGKPAPEAEAQKPDTLHPAASMGVHTTAPADMPEVKSPSAAQAYATVPSPSPWPSAVTVVVVAMSAAGLALLWLLLKNRRNAG